MESSSGDKLDLEGSKKSVPESSSGDELDLEGSKKKSVPAVRSVGVVEQ